MIMFRQLTPIDELTGILDKLEKTCVGYHQTYYTNLVQNAIAAFDSYGFFKYFVIEAEYREVIEKAKAMTK
jgi:hypothetical protein